MTFIHFLTGKSSGILSDMSSGILSGILSGISSGISSGILSGKSSGILSGISSGILSGDWGPAVPTGIWSSRLTSGSAHWDLELAVDVRQCPLGSGARGWRPAVPTGIWSSVEVRLCPLGSRRRRVRRRRRRRRRALLKSSNPHLAGGEKEIRYPGNWTAQGVIIPGLRIDNRIGKGRSMNINNIAPHQIRFPKMGILKPDDLILGKNAIHT